MSHCCWRGVQRKLKDHVGTPRRIRHPSGQRAFAFLLLLLFGVRFGPLPLSVLCLLFAASRVGFVWRPFVVLVSFRRWSRGFSGSPHWHLKSIVVPLQYSARMSYMNVPIKVQNRFQTVQNGPNRFKMAKNLQIHMLGQGWSKIL